jgi:hypothetical protein
MIVNALKKDLVLLNKQKKATEDYIKVGCGQFLNVGNDQWCGNYKEVLRLYKDMIKFANKAIEKLNNTNDEYLFDKIYDVFEKIADASEANVFLEGEKWAYEENHQFHHSLFPNFVKLV